MEIIKFSIDGQEYDVAVFDVNFINGNIELLNENKRVEDIKALKSDLKTAIDNNRMTNLFVLRATSKEYDKKSCGSSFQIWPTVVLVVVFIVIE